jgi:hypothetical protein
LIKKNELEFSLIASFFPLMMINFSYFINFKQEQLSFLPKISL